jgi:hypothetical protein
VLHSVERNGLSGALAEMPAKMMQCGLEIVNRLRHGRILKHLLYAIRQFLVLERNHRPNPRRSGHSDILRGRGFRLLGIGRLQIQKSRLRRLRLDLFRRVFGFSARGMFVCNCNGQCVPAQAF